ncbi:Hypothetical predicted protein [Mytilus galloprovincialis]|uniref:HECT domain-containing protein n=2 Tax=Mytilus galloprovincialis TaxID=29158 RepID=A0A8B6H5F4_MYTGA|nr:Hypothetical predicted protein [Mytilus galloprovincialis]
MTAKKRGHLIGNSYAAKKMRRVDFGWAILDVNTQEFKKLREPTGGGIRKTELDKDTNTISLLNIALDLFFVNGKSPHGHLDEFTYKLTDFKLGDLDDAITVGELYELTKVKILRLYLCTTRKINLSHNRIEKTAIKQYSNSCISPPSSTVTSCISPPSSTVTLDETSIGDCSLLDFSDIVIFGQSETVTSDMLSETVKDIVCTDSLLSQLPERTRTFSVPEGQSSHTPEILPTVLPRSPSPPPDDCIHIRLHRLNIMEELIAHCKNPDIITCTVKFDFVNEKGADATGVSRDVYSTFWNNFFSRAAEGEGQARVPSLISQWQNEEWKAIGRILLKGYMDHSYFPLQFATAFVCALIHGESSLSPDMLMSSFLSYMNDTDREIVTAALKGNLQDDEKDDFIDILDRFDHNNIPSPDEVKHVFSQIAHKELIQKTKYALAGMAESSRDNLVLLFPDTAAIKVLYEARNPTVKSVLKLLQAQPTNKAESDSYKYFKQYIKSQEDSNLRKLLQYITGSNVICVERIAVMFTYSEGLLRHPVAHTCGPTLELPATYNSYPDLRGEFDSILGSDKCMEMLIA